MHLRGLFLGLTPKTTHFSINTCRIVMIDPSITHQTINAKTQNYQANHQGK
jgi:hypothetical protein